jgi:NAD(P)H dehydrogenase (quinone)
MIVISGASGKLGREVVERLLAVVPAEEVGLSVRQPDKVKDFAERGVRVRRGEFEDRAALQNAFEGANQVLVISSDSFGEVAVAHHQNAIEAAKAVGATRITYTNHMGSNAHSHFQAMRDHAATEALLQESGVPFTSLRNGFYISSALQLMGRALETGKLVAPADGAVSWTGHSDLAEAAVIALTHPERLNVITPPLTGSEILNFADIAALASELTGQAITRVTVPDEEWKAGLVSRGVPEQRVDFLLGIFAASRAGEFATTDPTLESLLGHRPESFRDVLSSRLANGEKTFF